MEHVIEKLKTEAAELQQGAVHAMEGLEAMIHSTKPTL